MLFGTNLTVLGSLRGRSCIELDAGVDELSAFVAGCVGWRVSCGAVLTGVCF